MVSSTDISYTIAAGSVTITITITNVGIDLYVSWFIKY